MPPGITFDPQTFSFSGAPTLAGEYVITLTATDNGTPSLSVQDTILFIIMPFGNDTGFNAGVDAFIRSTSVQPDGKIVIGGFFTSVGGVTRNRIARLNADGTVDAGFNPDANSIVYSTAVQADGKIVIGGQFTTMGGVPRNSLARVQPDGTLDAGFNPDVNGLVLCTTMQSDGKILIGGFFTSVSGTSRNRIARLHADGTLDASFNPNASGDVNSVVLQSDGKILVGGSFNTVGGVGRSKIARLNADGSIDLSFNPGVLGGIYVLALQADGKVLVGGSFITVGGVARNNFARLNSNGTVDATFDPNVTGSVSTLAVQADGLIIVGGTFTAVGGAVRNNVARVRADGTVDPNFNANANTSVASVVIQADGRILAGGNFISIGGASRNFLALLRNDPANQNLTVPNTARTEWLRGGAAPEAEAVTFELSNDGMTWTLLGSGTRISGGWELTGLGLSTSGIIRARARTSGGHFGGSSGLVEQETVFNDLPFVPPTPVITWANPEDILDGTLLDSTQLNATATFSGSPVAGSFTYNPPAGTVLPVGNAQTLSVTFTPDDLVHYAAVSSAVSINVIENQAPVAFSQSVGTFEDTALQITLSGEDPEGAILSYSITQGPSQGILSGTPPNLIYTPAPDHVGTNGFIFTVSDGQRTSAPATVHIQVTDVVMSVSSISPTSAVADATPLTLTVSGSDFEPDSVVYWNGNPRLTTFVSANQITALLLEGDLAAVTDIVTALVQVGEPTGPESNSVAFAILPSTGEVGVVEAAVAIAGETTTVSAVPVAVGDAGVAVEVTNIDGPPVTVLAATYVTQPATTETGFQVDTGGFVDVQITGADNEDVAEVNFHFLLPDTTTAPEEINLAYFDGSAWATVLDSDGNAPSPVIANNGNGTISVHFMVEFNANSTPPITGLTGTIFVMTDTQPQIQSVAGPMGPVALGDDVTISVPHAVVGNPMAAQITVVWGDGTQTIVTPTAAGQASATKEYSSPGVYSLILRVTDEQGSITDSHFDYVVVYDPNGGFVTGGGWINSPAGAHVANPTSAGKASFGFVAKYQKGASVPTGNTEFQFKAGNLNFKSTAYQWLVVAGAKAQYKGVGTKNGDPGYGFLLSAIDGNLLGTGKPDRFRIKIWIEATGEVIYDNQTGAGDTADLTTDGTLLGGGSIVIHKTK